MTETLQVQRVPAASLVLDEQNVRTHGKRNLEAIRGSLKRFGQVEPLVVQKGTRRVLAGNGRLLALRELGVTEVDIVEVDVQAGDAAALAVALNRTAELAGWDMAKLKTLIDETAEIDWGNLGWSEAELRQALLEADIPIESRPGQSDPDEVPVPPVTPITQPGDLWILPSEIGEHRVLCGDATKSSAVQRLLRDEKPFLMVTDPPYGVDYTPEWRDGVGEESPNRSRAPVAGDTQADWKAAYALFPGDVAYVWHASLCSWIVAAGLHEVEFDIRAQIVWCKPSPTFSRGAYHWQHEPCQPPGTMVRTPEGVVPIEALKDGDRVLSYNSYSSVITGKRDGRTVKVAVRPYSGDLYAVSAGGCMTRCTDGHQFSVKFTAEASQIWCTYLMRRGDWWRVGILRTFNSRGFGLSVRLEQEDGDEAWLLGTYSTRGDAMCAEQVLSVKYGIPTTHWNAERSSDRATFRTADQIRTIYEALDLVRMEQGACRVLGDHGRRMAYPLVTRGESHVRHSRRVTVIVRACNVIPKIMAVPKPKEAGDEFTWETVCDVGREPYAGPVYSLDVAVDHHYVADGLVTHNCWYAVRKGKPAKWGGDRRQSTTWELTPPKDAYGRSGEDETPHATQKPIECMERPIRNHGGKADAVYDPFLGSGTTLLAAERQGRRCFGIEIEPKWVDVAVARWEKYTGKKAVRQPAGAA